MARMVRSRSGVSSSFSIKVRKDKPCKPTIISSSSYDAEEDAATLKLAIKKGFGTDEKAILDILSKRGIVQRLEIAAAFKTLYGKDLLQTVKTDLGGKFESVISALLTPLPEFYAMEVNDALTGVQVDVDALIEIFCTMSNYGIKTICSFYEQKYGKNLESEIKKQDYPEDFKNLCLLLLKVERDDNSTIDAEKVKEDAKTISTLISKKDDKASKAEFYQLLAKRSYKHLQKVFFEYENLVDSDIEEVIEKEYTGDVKKCLLAIVKTAHNKVGFFAERLYHSMKGFGTCDKTLTRIIVSRSEIDLGDIKEAFYDKYGKSLAGWISDDRTGTFKTALIAIMNTNN